MVNTNKNDDYFTTGCAGGLVTGAVAGVFGTIWGGYELGSGVADYINLQSTVGRGALEVLTGAVLLVPSVTLGVIGGGAVGTALGGIAEYVIDKKKLWDHRRELSKKGNF